jgi:hypothetical protein
MTPELETIHQLYAEEMAHGGIHKDRAEGVRTRVLHRLDQPRQFAHFADAQGEGERGRPTIVCLCGSTRFKDVFDDANYRETMAGKIVLSVGFFMHASGNRHGEGIGATPEQKVALDELHLRKIDLADEVLVLNVGGYYGDSTRREIAHAHKTGKPVRWLEVHAPIMVASQPTPEPAPAEDSGEVEWPTEPSSETVKWFHGNREIPVEPDMSIAFGWTLTATRETAEEKYRSGWTCWRRVTPSPAEEVEQREHVNEILSTALGQHTELLAANERISELTKLGQNAANRADAAEAELAAERTRLEKEQAETNRLARKIGDMYRACGYLDGTDELEAVRRLKGERDAWKKRWDDLRAYANAQYEESRGHTRCWQAFGGVLNKMESLAKAALAAPAVEQEKPERPPMLLGGTHAPFGGASYRAWFVRSGDEWMQVDSDVFVAQSRELFIDRNASDPEAVRLYENDKLASRQPQGGAAR